MSAIGLSHMLNRDRAISDRMTAVGRLEEVVSTAEDFDRVVAQSLPLLLDRAAGYTKRFLRETGQWSDDAFFSLDQVMRGLDDYYDGVLVPGGPLDQAALTATLAPPQLGGLVAAAKQAFYSDVYEAGLLYENIPGGLLKVVVLYFPEAARVLVVRIKAL